MCKTYLRIAILEAIALDGHYLQVKDGLQHENVQQKYEYYKMEGDGTLMCMNKFYVFFL